MRKILTVMALVVALGAASAAAQERIEKNVVYGMYSGLALLMDVHYPERPNGYGIVYIAGSGWQAQQRYGAPPLKESQLVPWVQALQRSGYTVFAINHRAAPRFHYPAAVEDAQRAVRFVRHHASRFGVNPAKLGGVGGSSGGHLIGLVAMLAAPAVADDPDPVNGQPATLQCIVLRAAPGDLAAMTVSGGIGTAAVVSFLERAPTPDDQKLYRSASPVTHVSRTSPPTLLLHGDADTTVPYKQSEAFESALAKAGVPVKLVRVTGGEHGATFGANDHAQLPEVLREMVSWLDQHLGAIPATK